MSFTPTSAANNFPPSSINTPVPSSPPPSESFFSDLDGTAPSLLENSLIESTWNERNIDPSHLNLVSWKLDVNARAEDGVEKRGFNAISTVLNHPSKKANPLRSTRKPLPPLTQPPPVLPKPPPPSHYDPYLQSITPLYDSFVAAQASSSSANRALSPQLGSIDSRPGPEDGIAQNLPSLDSVPEMFFDTDFDLANPSTWSELLSSSDDPDPSLQDNLSTHLDTLERHLVHEITLRSSSFFSALSNLQDLHSESASCLSRITGLQQSLTEVGQKQARKGLEVIDAQEKLRVLRVTEAGARTVGELDEILRFGKRLVDEGDWAGGLGCVEDVVRWWEKYALQTGSTTPVTVEVTESSPQQEASTSELPLATLPALSGLPMVVNEVTSAIATQLEAALSAFLLSTLSQAAAEDKFRSTNFAAALEPMLSGLVRCGKIHGVESVWREVVTVAIRDGSRQHLPVGQADDDGDAGDRPPEQRGANLAQSLQAMDHSSFLLMTTKMYATLLDRLKLAQHVGEAISSLLETLRLLPPLRISTFVPDTPTSVTSPTLPSEIPDLTDVVSSGCELAHSRASKVLAVRSEQHPTLPLNEFVEIFRENWDFIVSTESLAKRMIVSLRGVTASQARSFLVSYHAKRLTNSAKLVEEEQWTQIDVSPSTQHTVDLLIESAVSDPAECAIPPPANGTSNGNGESGGAAGKTLSIEGKTYFVVKATAESLILLGDYLKIVINLELVVTDVMSRIIEFLKSFNSRTCQVVLGAGAMRSAGLKNITAKHLALASQSLSVIIALIPYIREFVRRHLSPKQAVMLTEFDKLKRDYQDHQNEIHAKLVAIMSDRLAVHCGSLREIDWEATPDKDGPRPYAEMLVKETATLHKVLSKYLAAQTVDAVMSEVTTAIVQRLGEEYNKVEFKSDEAKKRMLQDVALISVKLKPLSEAGPSLVSLENIVKEKVTPRKPMGQTMAGLLRRGNSTSSKKDEVQVEGEKEVEDDDEDEDGAGLVGEPEQVSANVLPQGEKTNDEPLPLPSETVLEAQDDKESNGQDEEAKMEEKEESSFPEPLAKETLPPPPPIDKETAEVSGVEHEIVKEVDEKEGPVAPPLPEKEV